MTTYTVRTSWSDEGYNIYGRRFEESFTKYWPQCIDLEIISDHQIRGQSVFRKFHDQHANKKTLSKCPTYGAIKWAHKVFALNMKLPDTDFMIWIDGDVETVNHVTVSELDEILEACDLAYLGRPWCYASETGFVAYRIKHPEISQLLRDMRMTYINGSVFKQKNWGDGYTFDVHRQELPESVRQKNLAAHLDQRAGYHVWPQTVLGKWLVHNKGPRRKTSAYGGTT